MDIAPYPVHPAAYGRANNGEVEDWFADFISEIQPDISDFKSELSSEAMRLITLDIAPKRGPVGCDPDDRRVIGQHTSSVLGIFRS